MLDERKAAILKAVVEEYIDTAAPVGSGSIAEAAKISVSSATIRNDMSSLEADGYLHQPHTSAGRVPTDKGYRYFVDSVGQARLARPESLRVLDFFSVVRGEIEDLMKQTAGLLSNLTDHAAVVIDQSTDAVVVRSVQLVSLTPQVALAIVVRSNGVVEKHTLEFDSDVSELDLATVQSLVSEAMSGHTLLEAAPLAFSGDDRVDALAQAVMEASGAPTRDDRVYVDGTSRVANGFDAVDSVRRVLTILEQQLVVVNVIADVVDRGLSVAIGSETGVERLEECSVVVSPYEIDGEHAGSIAVLGPTRMDYPQALAAVAVVSRQLGQRLSEG